MFKYEIRLFKNYIKNNIKKIFLYTLLLLFLMIFIWNILANLNLKNGEVKIFQDLYYVLMFLYIPSIYFSLEHFFRSKRIEFLRYFALENKKLASYLILNFIFKLLIFYFLQLIAIIPFLFRDSVFFYYLFIYISVYMLMFGAVLIVSYSFVPELITDDTYKNLRQSVSAGWGNEKLAPFLFAPAFVFTGVNFLNIIVSKILEKALFEKIYDIYSLLGLILIVFCVSVFIGFKKISKNLLTLYAVLSEYKSFYEDTSYIVENSFKEEKIVKILFKEISFNIMKDIKILKRSFRLNYLFVIVSFLVFVFNVLTVKNDDLKFIVFLFVYLIAYFPVTGVYFFPLEADENNTVFPLKRNTVIYSKVISSFMFLFPLFVYSVIFFLYYRDLSYILFIFLFVPTTIFSIFIKNKNTARYISLFLAFLSFYFL